MTPQIIANSTVLLMVEVALAIAVAVDIVRRERRLPGSVGPGKYLVFAWLLNAGLFASNAVLCLNLDVCIVARSAVNIWSILVDLQAMVSLLVYMSLFCR